MYTSHLDVQRTLQRSFRRADLPLVYSQGFNPHPLLSFSTALATGYSSDAEWLEFALDGDCPAQQVMDRVNAVLPRGFRLFDAFAAAEQMETLSKLLTAAEYTLTIHTTQAISLERWEEALTGLLGRDSIIVTKKTKGGPKPFDIRPQILSANMEQVNGQVARMTILGALNSNGGLRVEAMLDALFDLLQTDGFLRVHRKALYFTGCDHLPCLPSQQGKAYEQGNIS